MSGGERPSIAWVGGRGLMDQMEGEGFRVTHLPLSAPAALGWDDIAGACGTPPDAVVYADRSLPPPLLGVERYPCLTAFYCIDSHIHSWYPLYAGTFDLCAVSLHDHLPRFRRALSPERVIWLPPFAENRYRPRPAQKEFDLLFVGTVNAETTPLRRDFLERLGNIMPGLAVRRGDFVDLLPRARVALNVAERGDLNFRVFEALACGSCLLTPRIQNGQDDLFREGRHFLCYAPDDERDAAEKARELLADASRRDELARAGAAAVEAAHRPEQRAAALAELLRRGFAKRLPAARASRRPDPLRAAELRLLWLHWAENCGEPRLAARYLEEAKTIGRLEREAERA